MISSGELLLVIQSIVKFKLAPEMKVQFHMT